MLAGPRSCLLTSGMESRGSIHSSVSSPIRMAVEKCLGACISDDLSLGQHNDVFTKKVNQCLNFLRGLRRFGMSPNNLIKLLQVYRGEHTGLVWKFICSHIKEADGHYPQQVLTTASSKKSTRSAASKEHLKSSKTDTTLAILSFCCCYQETGT